MNKTDTIVVSTILVFALLSSAFFVFFNSATVKAQTTTTPSNLLQYEWVKPAASSSRSFFSDGPAPNQANLLWKASIPGAMGAPVAFNGKVFVQGSGGKTYALDPGTGNIIWVTNGTGNMGKIDETYMVIGNTCVKIADGSFVWKGPAGFSHGGGLFGGVGYVSELKMFLDETYGWSLSDPAKPPVMAWNITSKQNIRAGNCLYGGGKLFIGSNDYTMKAVEPTTGNTIWEVSATTTFVYGASYYNGMVIQGGLDNNMRAWDANTGDLIWTYNPHTWYGQWASATAVAYGMVYEHNQDNYVYAINAATGELVWRQLGPGIGYSNTLTVADGKVYVQMGERQYRDFNTGEYANSEFDCFDAYTGKLIWTLPVENGAPQNLQCHAYGNLYMIPSKPTPQEEGVWTYSTGGALSLGEVWCIGSQARDWPQYLANPEHSAEGAGPTNLAFKWKFTTGGPVVSSATCVDGIAYFGSSGVDYNIYAVDANTGAQKWAFKTGYQIYSSVAVVDGKVYTGASDGNVYCIDANTGTEVWKTFAGGISNSLMVGAIGSSQLHCSPVVLDGRVYAGSLDGNLYCLDAEDGSVIWKFKGAEQCIIVATPTISDGVIYLASERGGYRIGYGPTVTNGDFYKLDLNGNVIWHKEIPYVLGKTTGMGNWLLASPTVAPDLGMVFLRNGYRLNYAFDSNTGDLLWTYDGRYNNGTPSQSGGVPQYDAMLYKYGNLYFNDYYGIVCLNAKNGSEVWYSYLSREANMQGVTYAYGRIYTVTEVGAVYVLDAYSGQKLSYYEFGTVQLHSIPVPYNGNLYVGSSDWNMYCLEDSKMANAAPANQQQSPTTQTPSQTNPPTTTSPQATSTAMSQVTPMLEVVAGTSDTTYILAGAVTVIAVIVVAAVLLFKKRK